jgi:uncharacterized membrane protein YeaQ/YmgE (transglycosylase-associated protein family)
MLILSIILFGMIIGAAAQAILPNRGNKGVDWSMAFGAGLIGSFVGGLLISLIAGDGLKIRPSGIIGSLVGAIIVTIIWRGVSSKR